MHRDERAVIARNKLEDKGCEKGARGKRVVAEDKEQFRSSGSWACNQPVAIAAGEEVN